MKVIVRQFTLSLLIACLSFPAIMAANSEQLYKALNSIYNSGPSDQLYSFDSLTIEYKDMEMIIGAGRFVFFPPVTIDSAELYYGGYYEGNIRIKYRPGLGIERDQMKRFFESEEIDRTYENITFLFGDSLYGEISRHIKPVDDTLTDKMRKQIGDEFWWYTKNENRYYAFWTLQNLLDPAGRQFFAANLSSHGSDRIFYIYNPFEREEVRLLKHYWYWHSGGEFMETVCSYSVEADSSYENINGTARPMIRIDHYDIKASIDRKGIIRAGVGITFETVAPSVRMLEMFLHPDLKIDSVLDSVGNHLESLRYEDDTNKSRPFYVILDSSLIAGDTTSLWVFYRGEVSRKYSGPFYITPGTNWYPAVYSNNGALFDAEFRTPKNYKLAATGIQLDSRIDKDTRITVWQMNTPARNISFSLGMISRYDFSEAGLPQIEIYFDQELHKSIAADLSDAIIVTGVDLEPSVPEDVINSLRLFSDYFGPYMHGRMRVSEDRAMHGEAFPGFIHLGVPGWYKSDDDGYISASRAHEVAHQWWGVGVEYETYHDQWLSEGFAEYCGLLYVQAALGHEKFIDLLREYRENVFNVRKYLFDSGKESGPIAMGYRTLSTETPGDYGLIIYEKAALCLHMLRNMMIDFSTMNEDSFFNMMREFYRTYRGRAATTADFKKLTEKYIGIDMTWFFDQWIYGNSLPTYSFTYRFERGADGRYTAICSVVTEGVDNNFKMYVPLEIEIDREKKAYIRVMIEGPEYSFSLPTLPKIPLSLKLNPFESVLARVKQ